MNPQRPQPSPPSGSVRWVLWNVQTGEVLDVDHQDPTVSLQLARMQFAQKAPDSVEPWAWRWAIEVEGCIDPFDARPLEWSDQDLLRWANG